MHEGDLQSHSAGRYNKWGHKKPLVHQDVLKASMLSYEFHRQPLSSAEKAALFLHELVNCQGLEFVAFSNVQLQRPVILPGGVVLYPCFRIDIKSIRCDHADDAIVGATSEMERRRRYVYDGWIPITNWDAMAVRASIQVLDEALSVFCLKGSSFFDWEPKYPTSDGSRYIYVFDEQHTQELEGISGRLGMLPEEDRKAMYRSLAWLTQATRSPEATTHFLLSILAIESLATYIEEIAADDSHLAKLRCVPIAKSDRRTRREACIHNTLRESLVSNPTGAIVWAYNNCIVGLKRRIRAQLERVFGDDREQMALLFEEPLGEKCLYDLRNDIAHGTTNVLLESERERVRKWVHEAEQIARRYVLKVLAEVTGNSQFSTATAMMSPAENAILSHERMYVGPTEMAFLY